MNLNPPRRFQFHAIDAATASFSPASKIGEGSTGDVFQGSIGGVAVAVKRLKIPEGATPAASAAIQKAFQSELDVLGSYHHARLVKLIGFAIDDTPMSRYPFTLIFELMVR